MTVFFHRGEPPFPPGGNLSNISGFGMLFKGKTGKSSRKNGFSTGSFSMEKVDFSI